MKVSIAMATYDGASFVDAQLASFLAQSRRPDELVVVDDASTDTTVARLEAFQETAPFPVHILSTPFNQGQVPAFSRALEATTGDVVFLSDQDDVWYPHKIRTVTDFLARHEDVLAVVNDAAVTDAELRPSGRTVFSQHAAAGRRVDRSFMGCAAAVRRDLLRLALPIPAEYPGHDVWLAAFAMALGVTAHLPEVLQSYRRHASNVTNAELARPVSVNRASRLLKRLRGTWSIRASDYDSRLRKWQLGSEGLRRGAERTGGEAATRLLEASRDDDRRSALVAERRRLRERPRVDRLVPALRLWRRGGYVLHAGPLSLLRDLFGP